MTTADVYKAMTLIGRGRLSLIDFEANHVYYNKQPGPDDAPAAGAQGPGGPLQEKP
jgi:hypothetical protein